MIHIDLISTDVLGDSASFAGCHARFANGIEQAGFAVVDVAHHRDHWWPSDQVIEVAFLDHFDGLLGRFFDVVLQHRNTEFLGHLLDGFEIQCLGDRGDDPLEKERFDDL